MDHLNPPTGLIADNVVGFARALRAAGIPVGPGAAIDALKALREIQIGNRAASRVLESGEPVKLAPMTPFERKVVHDAIAAAEGVHSESEGVEPERRVVVLPGA